jgi:CubicO group peptidase (beta-lactamase class C family)
MKNLIIILLISWLNVQVLKAQKISKKIVEVENSLMPLVPIEGLEGWNILDRMKYHNIQGASIAVINNYKVEWAKAYGWADTARKIPMTVETMLSAGSISKFILAAGAFDLVEQQKLSLNQPINNYLTSWKLGENDFTKKKPVTLKMLLSHTGGTSQSAYFGYEANTKKLPTIVEILDGKSPDGTRRVGVNKEPSTGFQYSGGGTLVAQLAMMDVSKTDFEPLIRSLVFNKLGMNNSTFEQPLSAKYASKASWGYQDAIWFKGTPYVYPQQGAAGLYSTATDLAKFIIEIQKAYKGKGKVLEQKSAFDMMKPQAIFSEGNVSKEQIAVGPFIYEQPQNTLEKGKYFYFDGANAGFIATAMGNLTEGYGFVVMVNSGNDYNGFCKEIRRAVAKTYNWYGFLPKSVKPINLTEKLLDEYTGRFKKDENTVVNVRRKEDYLVIKFNNDQDIFTFPIAKDTVLFTDYNIRGWFSRNDRGEVIGIQNEYQKEPMQRLNPTEFTMFELLRDKKYEVFKDNLRTSTKNEYELTYMAYEASRDLDAAKAILEVAEEKFPKSAIVFARWGDLYMMKGDKEKARQSYEKVLKFDPQDVETKKKLKSLE